jgi:glucosylceramidase
MRTEPRPSAIRPSAAWRAAPLCAAFFFALAVSCAPGRTVGPDEASFFLSDGFSDFQRRPVAAAGGLADLDVSAAQAGPAIEGFGGAFNEKGWAALQALPAPERQQALERMFKPGSGLSLSFCRIPIGSSDYALSRYSLDGQSGDFAMRAFSVERDREALIPYVKAAQSLYPGMRFWASAWSPPPWMKDNRDYDWGSMRDEPEVLAAYALYLRKFTQAYAREGIKVEAVAVQNEPSVLTNYPSCSWTAGQYLRFVRDYLGPALQGTGTGVMLGTFNQPDNRAHALAVLSDGAARAYVSCLGLQWDGLPIAAEARRLLPGLAVWHTETDCGNHHWEPGFDPDKPQNDIAYAIYTWGKMRDYLGSGASLYSLWNIVLDGQGKSIDALKPWPQNSAIVADAATGKAVYTPMYYAFSSFSRFIPPGSRLLESKAGIRGGDALAFALPSGEIAVAIMNDGARDRGFAVKANGKTYKAALPKRSFGTLIIGKKDR